MNVDVAAFMRHVRDRGFVIQDYGVISGVRRFDLLKPGDHNAYFDVDTQLWPDVTQEWLIEQADTIIDRWKPIEMTQTMDDWETMKMRIRARHKERQADEHLLELLKQGLHRPIAPQMPTPKEPQPQTLEEMIDWLSDLRKQAIHRGEE